MPTTTSVSREPDNGPFLTFDELAAFVDEARTAGVPGDSRLQVRTKLDKLSGPYLRTIATAPAKQPAQR